MKIFGNLFLWLLIGIIAFVVINLKHCDSVGTSISNCENANEYLLSEHERMAEELNRCRDHLEQ